MVEKYFIENDSTDVEIRDSYFVEKVYQKQLKEYSESSAMQTRQRVQNVFKNCLKLDLSNQTNKNVLFVGKVQSGKTSNLEMFTAYAFDNGYKCVIIYGGYDKKLLKQTSDRFAKTFDIDQDSIDENVPELISTDDDSVHTLDDVMDEIIDSNKPIIFVSMKRPLALSKVNESIRYLSNLGIKTFIIDDEGDQASLNTEFKKNQTSATYKQIIKMKEILRNPLYISVTATPQANVLLGEYSQLKPNKLFLIEPGDGYTGSDFFHYDDEHMIIVDDDDVKKIDNEEIPESLYNAIHYFVVASALMKKRGYDNTDMIIHTHRVTKKHKQIYSCIYQYIDGLKGIIKENHKDAELQIRKIIKNVFNITYFSQDILDLYDREELVNEIKEIIAKTHIILQDSDGSKTQGNSKYKFHKIYIGGDLLQRGLTFKFLITTYFTRRPKKSGNMDTIIQRARWFGYRSKYLSYCKIFTTRAIQNEYSALTESENDLRDQFYLIEKGELQIDDIVIDADSSTLYPTRKNVVDYKDIKFSKKWNNQKTGYFDKQINLTNDRVINSLFEKLEFKPSFVGKINSSTPSCYYSNLTKEEAITLFTKTSSIFNDLPFNVKDLIKLSKEYPIIIQKMFSLDGQNDYRKRSFDYASKNILALQQGPDKADDAEKTYKGDSAVIVDESAMTIQVFRIVPRFKKDELLHEYEQYMFSIHIPETRRGFVKYERH